MSALLIMLPIAFPFLSVIVSLVCRNAFERSAKRRNTWVAFTLVLEAVIVLFASAAGTGILHAADPGQLKEGISWAVTDRISLIFRIDPLSVFFSSLTAVIWLCAGIFSFEYMKHEDHCSAYYRFYLLIEGAIVAVACAGNYVTLYMSFEFMSILSFPLVMHARTKEAIVAAQKYLFYSVFGACLGLAGVFYLSAWLPGTVFREGGYYEAAVSSGHVEGILIVVMLAVIGFGTKAGMFPMHAWLPTAHPVAPAPASAVMSGIITKCGIVAVIRIVFYLTGAELIRGTWVQYVWMILALLTVFMGSMLAYMERGFKKRLAYSSVSQVSYVLFGLSTLTVFSLVGALLHILFHSVIKDLLFLCSGAVIHKTGETRVDNLRGIGKRMPVTMWCFVIASLGLVGIPPACGFFSKWYLAMGALSGGMGVFSVTGPVILLISALLTAGYLFTICMRAFLPGRDFDYARLVKCDPGPLMTVPMIILAAAVMLLGLFAGPFVTWFTDLAELLL